MSASLPLLKRYYHTLKYLKPIQHYTRLKLLTQNRWYRLFPELTLNRLSAGSAAAERRNTQWPWVQGLDAVDFAAEAGTLVIKVEGLLRYEFSFLNQTVAFASPEEIGWHDRQLSHLWRYHLHYFDYARDLGKFYRLTGDVRCYRCFRELALSWIAQNPAGTGDGWHPYPVSLRLVNWIYASEIFEQPLAGDKAFKEQLTAYLWAMAGYLAANLEYHVLGNHLLENARALIFAGMFFRGRQADRWLQQGRDILREQAGEQILPDGGHFELSPMYHTIVLANYLECIQLLQVNGVPVPVDVLDRVKSMLVFQKQILHPDGQNPLFNDSALQMGPDPQKVLQLGSLVLTLALPELVPELSCPDSGYYLLRNQAEGSMFIIDCGKPCPDYLPAHAHADILSFELSLFSRRFIVDSGVYEYTQGSSRDYFRSTQAHNTVTVNEQNQSEVWASFRVGLRGRPLSAGISRVGRARVFQGSHDSYQGRFGVTHTRYIAELGRNCWVVVDELTLARDLRQGLSYSSYLHFHPEVSLDRREDSHVRLDFCGHQVELCFFAAAKSQVELVEQNSPLGTYSDRFGVCQPKLTLKMTAETAQPLVFGYVIAGDIQPQIEFLFESVQKYSLRLTGRDCNWELQKLQHSWLIKNLDG